jgi:hypothetical protein
LEVGAPAFPSSDLDSHLSCCFNPDSATSCLWKAYEASRSLFVARFPESYGPKGSKRSQFTGLPERCGNDSAGRAMSVDESEARHRAEQGKSDAVASAIATACAQGDVDAFLAAVGEAGSVRSPWRLAYLKIGKLPAVSPEIRRAFLSVWVEHKMLPLHVGDRRVLARALRLLLPSNYGGAPQELYRGAAWRERCYRRYGFSWTTDLNIARNFAKNWQHDVGWKNDGGVVLRTIAAPDAVLLIREPEDYYDEGEVVVDPFRLGPIKVAERLAPTRSSDARSGNG